MCFYTYMCFYFFAFNMCLKDISKEKFKKQLIYREKFYVTLELAYVTLIIFRILFKEYTCWELNFVTCTNNMFLKKFPNYQKYWR